MEIDGKVWKSKTDKFWLAEIPFLNLMVQAKTKKEIPEMIRDAVELLIDDTSFSTIITLRSDQIYLSSNDSKKLIGLILKRQRLRKKLKLEEVAKLLRAKSINDYAQYEQAKHLPSFEKFEELLKAIDPEKDAVLRYISK